MQPTETNIRLTQFSHSAGCGCKIAPATLRAILQTDAQPTFSEHLLVGNQSSDDAAAYDLGDGNALIATTDFFMPIVDDAFDFGRVAAANAISDVYAMGGKPIMAIAILGWPIDKLPHELAGSVLDGARAVCKLAGIPLAGGHSIDSPEPIFGLSVNGLCPIGNLKRNNTAKEGDLLFLTKPIGVGILATAQKRGVLHIDHQQLFIDHLTRLNNIGAQLGTCKAVTAMTDVTGFGLGGHLIEVAEGSNLSAELYYNQIPKISGLEQYLTQRIVPDATYRNWNSMGTHIHFETGVNVMEAFNLLPDPQTNGGLLIAVDPTGEADIKSILHESGLYAEVIGKFTPLGEKRVRVI